MSRTFTAALLLSLGLPVLTHAQLTDPIPAPIAKGSIGIELEPVASGLTAPVQLTLAGDGSGRLFVVDQAGQILVHQNGQIAATPFLDVSSLLPPLGIFGTGDPNDFDERGLLGLAFHPGYSDPQSAGFGKFYTYHSEPVGPAADFTLPLPGGAAFDHQNVVSEWSVDPSDPNLADASSRRELFRMDHPQFNHNAGGLEFGPDGYLYISVGDGGNANDAGDGHTAIGNGQDLENPHGSLLRIDVDGDNSANGQYGIPGDNPFANGGGLAEIFAYGLRNPYRFSHDSATGRLILPDVGQNQIEEINIGAAGGNYGWRLKEGTFKFDHTTGEITDDLTGLPPGLIDPVAQYDHDEGLSIIGGFMYRGSAIPELQGRYVFGDFSGDFFDPTGRLFSADLATGVIEELVLGTDDRELGLFVKGFGQDADGELYLLAGTNLGPFGSLGQVYKIVPVPEPSGGALMIAGVLILGGAVGRRNRRRA